MGISAEKQVELLRTTFRIRAFEERVRDLFAAGRLPGFVHLSIGQEGVAAGAFGAQVAAWIAEEVFDAPVRRVAARDVPIPFSPPLEEYVLPQVRDIVDAVRQVVREDARSNPGA